jgi:N-methylhydantoinase B/oxoprolinase/acetone carboxylase alpha subunit
MVDPITVEVIRAAMNAAAEEMKNLHAQNHLQPNSQRGSGFWLRHF